MTTENIGSSATGKKIFLSIKGKQTVLCLEISFCDFRCRAVEVSRLKMAFSEFNGLRKTFDDKIMTFPSALETLGRWFQITHDICMLLLNYCKFVAFSILLWTQTVHFEITFNLVKCNLTKLTTTSLAVKWSTSLAIKRFISLAVKRFTSLAVKRFTSLAVKRSISLAVHKLSCRAVHKLSGHPAVNPISPGSHGLR